MTAINKAYLLPSVLVIFRGNRRRIEEKLDSSALNKMDCDRKLLVITFERINQQNIKFE